MSSPPRPGSSGSETVKPNYGSDSSGTVGKVVLRQGKEVLLQVKTVYALYDRRPAIFKAFTLFGALDVAPEHRAFLSTVKFVMVDHPNTIYEGEEVFQVIRVTYPTEYRNEPRISLEGDKDKRVEGHLLGDTTPYSSEERSAGSELTLMVFQRFKITKAGRYLLNVDFDLRQENGFKDIVSITFDLEVQERERSNIEKADNDGV